MVLFKHWYYTRFRDPYEQPEMHLFDQLKRITRQWIDEHLVCKGRTYPAQLMYLELADKAYERITAAITRAEVSKGRPIKTVLDSYNLYVSTANVNFTTTRTRRWQTDARRCHVNYAVLDSEWKASSVA
jgi:type III restriction enzyme